jgi:hypothetical protein
MENNNNLMLVDGDEYLRVCLGSQALSLLKEWLLDKRLDKSEHRTIRLGYGLVLNKIKELQGE